MGEQSPALISSKGNFMIRTKNLITDITDVPSQWVFNNYLDIGEILTGQDVMIKSVFNPKDKRPSMSIYVTRGREYKFYDHSTGTKGSKIDIIMHLFGVSFPVAVDKILQDYNKFLEKNANGVPEVKEHARYRVTEYNRRKWTVLDRDYWTAYHISSKDLLLYNVYPLSSYTLSNGTHTFQVEGNMIYGYFTANGILYKIYQPRSRDRRFMKMHSYMQGVDQLEFKQNTVIITKALKDVICFHVMGMEAVASDSENTILPESFIQELKKSYKNIIVIMDNDEPGIAAMKKYNESYGLPYIILPLEKDPSDSIKVHGIDLVQETLQKLIKNITA